MSGHNKWSKIKHKKAATDAAKSKVFSKLNRLLTVEAKKADGDINSPGLRVAIEKAKKENMPGDTIDRAIKKATEDNSAAMEAVVYESYGPGGTAIIVEGLTDNKNRSAAEIRHILSRNGLELAASGSATWAFTKKEDGWEPNNTIDLSDEDLAKMQKVVEDLEDNDDVQEVYTNAE